MLRTAARLVAGTPFRSDVRAGRATRRGVDRAVPSTVPPLNVRDLDSFGPFSEARFERVLRELNEIRKPGVPEIAADTEEVDAFRMNWEKNRKVTILHAAHSDLMGLVVEDDTLFVRNTLNTMLNNVSEEPWVPLVEREKEMALVNRLVEDTFEGLPKTSLLALSSARGSGKTQLLKACLYTSAFDQICSGAVMIIECSKPKVPFVQIMDNLRRLDAKHITEKDVNAIGAELIRAHVKYHRAFGGKEIDASVVTIADARAQWMQLVQGVESNRKARKSEASNVSPGTALCPLIVFDTMEVLPQTTAITRTQVKDGSKRSFVEAFAYLIDQAGLIAVGTKLPETRDVGEITDVTRARFPRRGLPALTYKKGYLEALKSWGVKEYGPITSSFVHYLSAGSPRLLRRASTLKIEPRPLRVIESWGDYLDELSLSVTGKFFESEKELPSDSEKAFAIWALAALASGTRTRVALDARMPLLEGCKWEDAAKGHLYSQRDDEPAHTQAHPDGPSRADNARVKDKADNNILLTMRMPPLFTLFDDVYDTFADLSKKHKKSTSSGAMAGASFLKRTWPRGLDLSFLHVAMKKCELKKLTFCDLGATKRGVPYEKLVATALVGRWYLLYLMAASSSGGAISLEHYNDPKNRRVALERVLGIEGDKRLNGVMVDFSDGLISMPSEAVQQGGFGDGGNSNWAVYHSGAGGSHHDMLFRAFKGEDEMTVCVQCRHGEHKNWSDIQKQCYTKPQNGSLVDLLFVVNQKNRVHKDWQGTLKPEELRRCVFVDSSVFCDDEALFVHHPTNKRTPNM